MSAMFWGSGAFANDVYIEQAGATSTFNITQTGTGNRVGTSGGVTSFTGNSQTIDIVQTGINNTADLTVDGGSTTINYSAVGDTNDLQVQIDGGTGNSFAIAKIGDGNRVTVCGANDAGVAANNAVACSAGVSVNDTTNIINVKGDSNNVNLALNVADATNTINIGHSSLGVAGTASNSNNVNITQTGGSSTPTTAVTINGSTNTVNITQQ